MNKIFQLNAKKELLIEKELFQLYLTPGLFLEIDKNNQKGLDQISLTKESKSLGECMKIFSLRLANSTQTL